LRQEIVFSRIECTSTFELMAIPEDNLMMYSLVNFQSLQRNSTRHWMSRVGESMAKWS
jgi:hypothetical protein